MKVRMSDLETKRRNRRESNQIQEGIVSLNSADTKQHKQPVIDNNFNTRNGGTPATNIKNENESPRKEKGMNDKEDAEKKNKLDKEGDAVMVVWKEEANKNNNLLGLDVTAKTEAGEEPVSPSPRVGRDAWSEKGEAEQGSQLSFNVRGTIERRKKVYMGSKSGHIGRYRHSRERNADNSITQMAQMDDENISQAVTQAGGCLTLHSKWKSQFDDSEASENETEMKGENLQSPEHKQGEPAGLEQNQPAGQLSAKALELSRITENTSKEGEKSNKTSPVHVEINKARESEGNKNSLHIEVNLPLPAAARTSSSPETKLLTEGKILQLSDPERGAGKPCVVIPPPPQIEPPPPPADFVPLQHSASAPSFNNRPQQGTGGDRSGGEVVG